ncbi:MAG: acetate--CoA ligase family protein [Nitrospiraceae bacterium]|nr:acetate--CoA ligase family protein [Nitrospiraceae bacterium]
MLDALFHPESVAVIGASADPHKVGYSLLDNLIRFGYQGSIYPVNPRASAILGLKAYPSLSSVPSAVDLAVIAIPAMYVPDTIRECIQKKVPAAVIVSAGFKEAGHAGALLEEELKAITRDGAIRILGPNCLGVINTSCAMNATFAAGMLPQGRISFFSQSGALGIAILDWAIGNRIGFSKFISLGNKADLNETDFIEYFINDEETDIILGYIEDVVQGRRFLDVARKATKVKPILLVKSGGTQAGARAASSHTGALAGSENAFNAAFRQCGIIRAEGIEDLFETAKAFNSKKLPAGGNLLIVTNAGGPGIIAADTAERLGLGLPQLTKETIDTLSGLLPKNASLYNPVDIIGDATADRYTTVFEHALTDPNVDGFLVILTPQATIDAGEAAEAVIQASGLTEKPFVTSFMGEQRVRPAIELLKTASIPNFSYPEPAVRSFRKLCDYAAWKREVVPPLPAISLDTEGIASRIHAATGRGEYQLGEDGAREILACCGFRFPEVELVKTPQEAVAAAGRIGFPVVMKISSPDILHKTDIGGVKTGIAAAKEVEEAFTEITLNARKFMPSAFIRGVNVYETVPKGKEIILGITYDRTFGHMIMFGLGGIYVEVLKDVSFRVVPLTEKDAEEMVHEIRSVQLLKGARGEKPVDFASIYDAVLRLSRLATEFPDVIELDINPLVVSDRGATALDARIILRRP